MAIAVTKSFRNTVGLKFEEVYSVAMNGATSGNFQTGIGNIVYVDAQVITSTNGVQITQNSNNGTVGSANGYVYIAGTSTDTVLVRVEGI